MWGIWCIQPRRPFALVALGLHALQHRGQEGCGIVFSMEKTFIQKDKG